ncbi:hypothetical protein [Streptomyces sp. NPDC015350]|uniref:hypothetical protein n=1 Tax=Streptomyces sp. NPDC015350 TaxID=3364955 RepID=UPI0036F5F04D
MPKHHMHSTDPFLDLRVGGLHLTVQRRPHGLLLFLASLLSAVGGAAWIPW